MTHWISAPWMNLLPSSSTMSTSIHAVAGRRRLASYRLARHWDSWPTSTPGVSGAPKGLSDLDVQDFENKEERNKGNLCLTWVVQLFRDLLEFSLACVNIHPPHGQAASQSNLSHFPEDPLFPWYWVTGCGQAALWENVSQSTRLAYHLQEPPRYHLDPSH